MPAEGGRKWRLSGGRGRVMHRCRDDKTGMQTMQTDSTSKQADREAAKRESPVGVKSGERKRVERGSGDGGLGQRFVGGMTMQIRCVIRLIPATPCLLNYIVCTYCSMTHGLHERGGATAQTLARRLAILNAVLTRRKIAQITFLLKPHPRSQYPSSKVTSPHLLKQAFL
jgi:hypothetical protein